MQGSHSSKSSSNNHVAVLPFPVFSHVLPLFNLTCKLAIASPEVVFSFFGSAKINSAVLSAKKDLIPSNVKTFNLEVPGEVFPVLVAAFPRSFEKAADTDVTFVITDAFYSYPVGELAEKLKLRWAAFYVAAPYSFAAHLHADIIQKQYMELANGANGEVDPDRDLEGIPGLSSIKIGDLPPEVIPVESPNPVADLIDKMRLKISGASAVIFSTYLELHSATLTNHLMYLIPNVAFVGFLTLEQVPLPHPPPSSADSTGCLTWLDHQKEASVIYISFGSVTSLPRNEMVELANALAEKGVPFLWSLSDRLKEQLPDGFLERTSKQGKVVPWTPQMQVLAHPSILVHLTHGGYHSVCESIVAAVAMICRSIWADNHMNARVVEEEWEIGIRVKGGVISKDGMLETLKMVEERKKTMRDSIKKLNKLVIEAARPDGSASAGLKTLQKVISGEC
nr:flavonol 3-O-rhamnosyltransferase [Hypericum monogynum]